MKLEVKKMSLRNFKGCAENSIEFLGNTKILGANGVGKTTLADAWYWVFADINSAMVKNPPITPLGMPECETRVEIEMVIDEKPITVAKTQKFKTRETDGKVTSSVTNGYEINSVDKSYKDFISDLIERGIDMDNFLIYSHPSAFTSDSSKSGREKQRELLFKMCDGISDGDIAKEIENIDELKAFLDNYRLDEVEQMQKSTIKKITESMGKDNCIVNARIDELLSQKSTQDEKVLKEQKKSYEAEIKRIEDELSNMSGSKADISKKISDLSIERDKIGRKANEELSDKKDELDKQYREYSRIIEDNKFQLSQIIEKRTRLESKVSDSNTDIEKQRTLYKIEQDAVLDEGDLVCPVCNRTFDEKKLAEIKKNFENNKKLRLEVIKKSGEDLKAQIKDCETEIKECAAKEKTLTATIDKTQKMCDKVLAELNELPYGADLSKNKEFQKLTKEITALEESISADDEALIEKLNSQKNVNKNMLEQVNSELTYLEKNKEIDKRISDLREERQQAEINRANAEKVLDQIERFKKEKNNRLSNEINKHFKFAQFRLFKTLKNGSVEDACDVLIDGKEINTQVNQASQILAKLDIIRGLSDFFGICLPVFVDDFALFTYESEKLIEMDNQLIKLVASNGFKKLSVDKG